MPRKQSKEDRDYKEGVAQYNEWNKMNKKFFKKNSKPYKEHSNG